MKYTPVMIFSLLCLMWQGCTTTIGPTGQKTQTLNPGAASAISGAVAITVPLAIQKDPNSGPYLSLVASVFRSAADSGSYDPASIQSALSVISAKELRSPEAQQIVTVAFAAYSGFFGQQANAKIDAAVAGPWLRQILLAVADGIKNGLPPQ